MIETWAKKKLKKIEEVFKHHIGILSEDFQHKQDIVAEGHQMLSEKIDRMDSRLERVEERLERVEAKVNAVSVDLSAHRADTESHRTGYRISESRD